VSAALAPPLTGPIAALPDGTRERVGRMLAELDAVNDGKALMELIDRARPGRDWLRGRHPEAAAEVDARFTEAFKRHVAPWPR
jgi:hypothetical protein